MRFKNPQTRRGHARQRHRARRPVPADPARRRPGAVPGAQQAAAGATTRPRPSTATSSTSTPTASRSSREHLRAPRLGRRRSRRPASTARGDRRARSRMVARLASASSSAGRWASPSTSTRSRPSGRSSTSCCCAATSASPAPGVCPVRGHCNVQGDRTMGIYEKPAAGVPRRARSASSASTPPREHGLRHRRRDPRDARRRGQGVLRAWAATSSPPRPTPTSPTAALRRCRLTVHVSTKLNRSHVVTGAARADPARPRPHRARRAGQRASSSSPSRTRWAWCTPRGAACEPGVARTCCREVGDRLPARARASLGDAAPASTGRTFERRLRPRSATASRASIPGFERLQRARARAGRLRAAAPAARRAAASPPPTGKAQLHRQPARRARACPPGRLLLQTLRSHDQYNTTIYGLDDRYRGINGGRRVVLRQPRRPRRAAASPTATCVDLVSEWTRRRRAPGAAASASSPTRPPAAARPRTSPRPTCSSRSTRTADDQQHPDLEVRRHPSGAGGLVARQRRGRAAGQTPRGPEARTMIASAPARSSSSRSTRKERRRPRRRSRATRRGAPGR